MKRRTFMTAIGATGAAVATAARHQAHAASYPTRPIRFIVPFPAGGSADLVARLIGAQLNVALRQPVVVDNKPGASGMIAGGYVFNAPADGYVLLLANNQIYNNPAMYRKVPYKVDDFIPVAPLVTNPIILVSSAKLPVSNVAELIAYARANPGTVNYASLGSGSTAHLIGLRLESMLGLKMVHVPYKGSGEAEQALISGDVQIYFDAPATAIPFIKAGSVRLLAVLAESRLKLFPDTPTLIETGTDLSATPWHGCVAPPGTPMAIVEQLNQAIGRIVAMPEVEARLNDVGLVPQILPSAQDFRAFIQAQQQGWEKVIKSVGLQLD